MISFIATVGGIFAAVVLLFIILAALAFWFAYSIDWSK